MASLFQQLKSLVPLPVKKCVMEGVFHFWWATGFLRPMPKVILIGASKCGGAALCTYLSQHPCVALARHHFHTDYFYNHHHKGSWYYRAHYPTYFYAWYIRLRHGHDLVCVDSSPCNMIHPHAPSRTMRDLPHVKLISNLRNPVDRTYSHYHHQIRKGRVPKDMSFEDALEMEQEKIKGEREKMAAYENYDSPAYRYFTFVTRSKYAEHLKNWEEFVEQGQLHFVKNEDIARKPQKVMNDIFDYIGLPRITLRQRGRYNVGGYKQKMNPKTRKKLVKLFKPFNKKLKRYFGSVPDWDK